MKCSIDGCDKKAVAKLLPDEHQNKGYRCKRCLEFDLDL